MARRRQLDSACLLILGSPLKLYFGLLIYPWILLSCASPDPEVPEVPSTPVRVGVLVPLCYQEEVPPPPGGRVAIIIDDLGRDLQTLAALNLVRSPLTLAVIPGQPRSTETALQAARRGFEVILHLPMEPLRQPGLGPTPGALRVGMDESEVARALEQALADVPGAVGLSNHMGSRATRSRRLMEKVLAHARARGLFFIDSRTTGGSIAHQTARELKVPTASRSIFLDANRSPSFIRNQFRQLETIARREGSAIGIGHPFPETLAALTEIAPEMTARGVELVFASELAH